MRHHRGNTDPGGLGWCDHRRERRQHGQGEDAARCAPGKRAFHEGKHPLLQNFATAGEPLLNRVLGEVERDRHVFH